MPEKGPKPVQKSRLPVIRKPKRVRNLLIAGLIGIGLTALGWCTGQWTWAIAGAVVVLLSMLSTWFSRKVGVLVVGIFRLLTYTAIRLVTALFFYTVITPVALLNRLRPKPWRASEQVLAKANESEKARASRQKGAPKTAAAALGGLLRPKGEPSYAAPPRRPPTAADFERLR